MLFKVNFLRSVCSSAVYTLLALFFVANLQAQSKSSSAVEAPGAGWILIWSEDSTNRTSFISLDTSTMAGTGATTTVQWREVSVGRGPGYRLLEVYWREMFNCASNRSRTLGLTVYYDGEVLSSDTIRHDW